MSEVRNISKLKLELYNRRNRTPDFHQLVTEAHLHPVFTYGTLKRGHGNHRHFLANDQSIYAGEAYTITSTYWMQTAGHFPVVFKDKDLKTNRMSEHIFGELYFVPLNVLCQLDHLESNGTMYQREKRSIFCLEQRYKDVDRPLLPSIKAWIYFGLPEYWENTNLGFSPIKTLTTNKGKEIRGFCF